jgi:AcrR family transcriptional regulator
MPPPLPRFYKLEDEKKEAILEVASEEFLEQGYEGASFNRIIERAGVSKGAMYYYFKDKADLYCTAIERISDQITSYLGLRDFEHLTQDSFWPELWRMQEKKLDFVLRHRWMLKLWGVGMRLLRADPDGPLGALYQSKVPLMTALFERGREVGAVRDDMPVELQLETLMAMGMVMGEWLTREDDLDEATLRERSRVFMSMMQQALTPPVQEQL